MQVWRAIATAKTITPGDPRVSWVLVPSVPSSLPGDSDTRTAPTGSAPILSLIGATVVAGKDAVHSVAMDMSSGTGPWRFNVPSGHARRAWDAIVLQASIDDGAFIDVGRSGSIVPPVWPWLRAWARLMEQSTGGGGGISDSSSSSSSSSKRPLDNTAMQLWGRLAWGVGITRAITDAWSHAGVLHMLPLIVAFLIANGPDSSTWVVDVMRRCHSVPREDDNEHWTDSAILCMACVDTCWDMDMDMFVGTVPVTTGGTDAHSPLGSKSRSKCALACTTADELYDIISFCCRQKRTPPLTITQRILFVVNMVNVANGEAVAWAALAQCLRATLTPLPPTPANCWGPVASQWAPIRSIVPAVVSPHQLQYRAWGLFTALWAYHVTDSADLRHAAPTTHATSVVGIRPALPEFAVLNTRGGVCKPSDAILCPLRVVNTAIVSPDMSGHPVQQSVALWVAPSLWAWLLPAWVE